MEQWFNAGRGVKADTARRLRAVWREKQITLLFLNYASVRPSANSRFSWSFSFSIQTLCFCRTVACCLNTTKHCSTLSLELFKCVLCGILGRIPVGGGVVIVPPPHYWKVIVLVYYVVNPPRARHVSSTLYVWFSCAVSCIVIPNIP